MKRTHVGRVYGVVPVYLDMTDEREPIVELRYWWCEPLLSFCSALYFMTVIIRRLVEPDFEALMPILITGSVSPEESQA